tara:strand:+ start:551 stop:946 length:396 start_codon:yes stop_codon:yes gene_type:complete
MSQNSGSTIRIELVAEFFGRTAELLMNIIHFWSSTMIYPGLIDAAMIVFLSLSVTSCQAPEDVEEPIGERKVIAYVCNHPGSIWHLSECNDQCTARDYNGEAYCHPLTEPQCENRELQTEFTRRACGLYNR